MPENAHFHSFATKKSVLYLWGKGFKYSYRYFFFLRLDLIQIIACFLKVFKVKFNKMPMITTTVLEKVNAPIHTVVFG